MGLELKEIVDQNLEDHDGLGTGILLALGALAIILVVRAAYVALLVWLQSRRARGKQRNGSSRWAAHRRDRGGDAPPSARRGRPRRPRSRHDDARAQRRIAAMRARVARALSDLDYYQASPLGWKHGTVIVWAGMRGVVTLAAAQTLPRGPPSGRSSSSSRSPWRSAAS